ncbi:hypothetical protein GOP47_0021125 [Adiantum capillus-veneris]|uniref:non-specific serine/threonine protein kinase n=1 Tax=Adiantum capillus-veneris TaxID=13818 RepID=A0A9D4UB12_ADICA|nr:hypothetical protein GOP47_0021125 [Adiantum capillus-veneris]
MVCPKFFATLPVLCASIPLLCHVLLPFLCNCDAATSFAYNGFDSDEARAEIICFQSASFQDSTLQLTETGATQASGRCLYSTPIELLAAGTRVPLSFSTQFIFYIQPSSTSDLADGISFVIAPTLGGVPNSSQGFMGIFSNETNGRSSTQTLAIEFDTYKNPEFQDKDENHIGIDVNDIVSWAVTSAAYRISSSPTIQSAEDGYAVQMKGAYIQAWIDYDATTNQLNVSISRVLGGKPTYPLMSNSSLNLSSLFNEKMYVGFTASTGPLPTVLYHVYAWSFSSDGALAANISMSSGNESNSTSRIAIIVGLLLSVLGLILVLVFLYAYFRRRRRKARYLSKKDWQVSLQEQLPQEFSYRELAKATNKFNEKNRLGSGGFGEVFQGVLPSNGVAVAVKRISKESKQGAKEFVSEVTTIGRLRHRNLVPLLGWCQEKGFVLVYELMPRGSLDKVLFNHQEKISWNQRLHILQGIAAALLYLHEECEQKIVHRDIKASNVMLDAQMNARLGDFGLARLYGHDVVPGTTNVAGTWGYMAPESFFTRKATEKTDVFSFGALALEVAMGKKMSDPSEEEGCSMIEWLWKLQRNKALQEAVELILLGEGQETSDMVRVVLELGLLCCYPDPEGRPSMRRVVQVLGGDAPPPPMPTVISSPFLFSSLALTSASQDFTSLSMRSHSDDSSSLLMGHSKNMSLSVETLKEAPNGR